MDQPGDWIVTHDLIRFNGGSIPKGSNFWIAGDDMAWFRVHTIMETLLEQYSLATLEYSKIVTILTYVLAVMTVVLVFLTWEMYKSGNKLLVETQKTNKQLFGLLNQKRKQK